MMEIYQLFCRHEKRRHGWELNKVYPARKVKGGWKLLGRSAVLPEPFIARHFIISLPGPPITMELKKQGFPENDPLVTRAKTALQYAHPHVKAETIAAFVTHLCTDFDARDFADITFLRQEFRRWELVNDC